VHWTLAVVALTLLAYASIAGRIAGTPITGPIVFTAVGLLAGSEALGLVELAPSGETVKLLAEGTLALVLFADASRLDVRILRRELSVPFRLLGIGLPLTLLAGFVFALVVFPEVLSAVTFIVFGAVLLGPALGELTWTIALYAILSLTVVRLLPVAIAMIGTGARRPTLAFLGWFGPRGLASIVFAILVLEEGGLPHDDLILDTTYVVIGLSVLAHGLTAAPLANRYTDWFESHPRDALPSLEGSKVQDVRWRSGLWQSRTQDLRDRD
jgi:NhaP-type Na+/H+ or K+/H+ antiporter